MLTVADDIDYPILKVVKLFNLWGCETRWSCCGFDYKGQPEWKSHTYGQPYVHIMANDKTFNKISLVLKNDIFSQTGLWRVLLHKLPGDQPLTFCLYCNLNNTNSIWTDKNCVHMYERIIHAIQLLENELYTHVDEFVDVAVINDVNADMKAKNEYWQFEAKEPYYINKSLMIKK